MTTTLTFSTPVRRRSSNELHITPIVKWETFALFICLSGLIFVYLKNQQHAIGDQTRRVEKQIAQVRAQNEVLLARVSVLSSRAALQRKLDGVVIVLREIQDNSIARLTPPVPAEEDGVLRTVANQRTVQ